MTRLSGDELAPTVGDIYEATLSERAAKSGRTWGPGIFFDRLGIPPETPLSRVVVLRGGRCPTSARDDYATIATTDVLYDEIDSLREQRAHLLTECERLREANERYASEFSRWCESVRAGEPIRCGECGGKLRSRCVDCGTWHGGDER